MLQYPHRRLRRRIHHRSPRPLWPICLAAAVALTALLQYSSQLLLPADHVALARAVIHQGLPLPELRDEEPVWSALGALVGLLTGFTPDNPRLLLVSSMPGLGWPEPERRPSSAGPAVPELSFHPEPESPPAVVRTQPSEDSTPAAPEPTVFIYHTHTSEMYLGAHSFATSQAHYVFANSSDSTITGVMEVGTRLAAALEERGLHVVHTKQIHDYPSLAHSYRESKATIRHALTTYPSLDVAIDLHRDAHVPEPVVTIAGERVARILFVIGTAADIPLVNPHWQANLVFAKKLQAAADALYPGLVRPIQVRADARFNQHLLPQSVLIEVGSVENTVEEALRSAELLADVLAEVLH